MGERRLVALLKELLDLNWFLPFYKHFTATRFSRHTRSRVLGYFRRGLNVIRLFSVVSIFAQDRMAIEFIEDF